jgi:hypothetical protein
MKKVQRGIDDGDPGRKEEQQLAIAEHRLRTMHGETLISPPFLHAPHSADEETEAQS